MASFTPLQPKLGIAHGDLRLVCGCTAMETHFMKLLMNSSCADVASGGSLEIGSECCNREMIFTRYAFQQSPFLFYGDCMGVCLIVLHLSNKKWISTGMGT